MTATAIDSGMRRAAAIAAAFVATLAVLVAAAFVWVWIYSEFIHPGGDAAYYQAYARVASPVVAVVLAGPVFYAMAVLMRHFGSAATAMALSVVGLNLLTDAASLLAFDVDLGFNLGMSLLAAIAKVTGAWLGARPRR